MSHHNVIPTPLVYARSAGVLYLAIIVLGIFSEVFVRAALVVPGDGAATAQNIRAAEGLFRAGFVGDTIVFLSDVAIAVLFYVLLRPVSPLLALMAMAFRLVQTAVIGTNLLNQYTALLILNSVDPLGAFSAEQLHALALLFMNMHSHGYDLGLFFFAINSLILGYLVYRAGFFPRALGVLLMAAGCVYLTGSYLLFIAPSLAELFTPVYVIPLVAELSFCLWLLVKGVDAHKWAAHSQS